MSFHEYMAGIREAYVRRGPAANRVPVAEWHEPFHGRIPQLDALLNEDPELKNPDGSLRYEIHRRDNGLRFLADPEKPRLQVGEQAVYPYHDEADMLLKIAKRVRASRGWPFNVVIDAFSGGGHSGLPMVYEGIAERVIATDMNPRAVHLAQTNAKLNQLDSKGSFTEGDIRYRDAKGQYRQSALPKSDGLGDALYIANPPFALKAKGTKMDVMRDGGENGLTLTLAYAHRAIQTAKSGDVIIGIGYSRIRPDKSMELKEELQKLINRHGGKLTVTLLEGQTLWRGFNGKKEQPNPMPITGDVFALKADPKKLEEVNAYKAAAKFHNDAGYTELGYFSYVIQM